MLIAYAKCNCVSRNKGGRVVIILGHIKKKKSYYFQFFIAKGLAICKFGSVISAECCTFKPLKLHMLSS
jgi:hypothetical protein